MKQIAFVVILVLCFIEIFFLYEYFSVFNGSISTDIQNWSLFSQIINGVVIALLTSINIWVFYKISIAIDNNNKERGVEQRLFEAQKVLTDMRIRQYEELSRLANQFKVCIYKQQEDPQLLEHLKCQLMSMDDSWLFKNDNIDDPNFLHDVIKLFLENYDAKSKEDKVSQLTNICIFVEFYIILQQHRNKDVENYIKDPKNRDYLDSTLICFDQLAMEILQKGEADTNK
jgi:hypothetical protein